uniref:Uncharacterized protein n=2 Tax=Methanococcus maripaludis (strain C5 / ATCC BAA-1333) TaxID=402880 RepID=O06110_METM5|nr:unknown [Methanococcus maripaludis C5]
MFNMENNISNIRKTFLLCREVSAKDIRYYLYKLENLGEINPEVLAKAENCEKPKKLLLTLGKHDRRIVEKYGKMTNTLLNYQLITEYPEGVEYE